MKTLVSVGGRFIASFPATVGEDCTPLYSFFFSSFYILSDLSSLSLDVVVFFDAHGERFSSCHISYGSVC